MSWIMFISQVLQALAHLICSSLSLPVSLYNITNNYNSDILYKNLTSKIQIEINIVLKNEQGWQCQKVYAQTR